MLTTGVSLNHQDLTNPDNQDLRLPNGVQLPYCGAPTTPRTRTYVYSETSLAEPQAHCEDLGMLLVDSVGQLAGLDFGINVYVCLGPTNSSYVDIRDNTVYDGWRRWSDGFPDHDRCYAFACTCSASSTAPPTPSPATRPPTGSPNSGGALSVTNGANFCQIDANGCATDGAGEHGNGEACTIRVTAAGFLTATAFDTESGFDYVTIAGTRYHASNGPNDVEVSANSTFTWRSDVTVTNDIPRVTV